MIEFIVYIDQLMVHGYQLGNNPYEKYQFWNLNELINKDLIKCKNIFYLYWNDTQKRIDVDTFVS